MITINCDNCGIEIERGQWALDNYKTHFCSNACKDAYITKPRVKLFCLNCGIELEYYPSKPRKFCSTSCTITYQKQHADVVERVCEQCGITFTIPARFAGIGGGRFCSKMCRGQHTSDKNSLYTNCEICGKEIRYTKNPESRFDLDNGITLCTGCHKEFHRLYGYKYFTSDDFIIFMEA